jgi:NAD(P)-dependent dehydrogenase (short-subunit alcohol dehydrogenase family)
LSTASVAGLMATPGLGPYNAAKYGVVAIMETLHLEMESDTEAHLGVSVLCPGVVKTNIATAQRNRPTNLRRERKKGASGGASADAKRRNANIAAALEDGMDPAEVGALVIQAMYDRQFWVLSHPELLASVEHRNSSLHMLTNLTLERSFTDGEQE